jgi:hypothetical protein
MPDAEDGSITRRIASVMGDDLAAAQTRWERDSAAPAEPSPGNRP